MLRLSFGGAQTEMKETKNEKKTESRTCLARCYFRPMMAEPMDISLVHLIDDEASDTILRGNQEVQTSGVTLARKSLFSLEISRTPMPTRSQHRPILSVQCRLAVEASENNGSSSINQASADRLTFGDGTRDPFDHS